MLTLRHGPDLPHDTPRGAAAALARDARATGGEGPLARAPHVEIVDPETGYAAQWIGCGYVRIEQIDAGIGVRWEDPGARGAVDRLDLRALVGVLADRLDRVRAAVGLPALATVRPLMSEAAALAFRLDAPVARVAA